MSAACDVLVIGYGYAGAAAAIAAHDAGARVLLIEKETEPGGISVCSAGGVRCSETPDRALAYLLATNGGAVPEPVLARLAEGMAEVASFVGGLAEAVGAQWSRRPAPGNYPFPGHDAFAFVNIDAVPGFDPDRDVPHVRGAAAGARLFEVARRSVEARAIPVRLGLRAERLIIEGGRVAGVATAEGPLRAAGGVVLATGGFEGSTDLQFRFWSMRPVLSAAVRTNTGDGLRMAQQAGASLWHLWHYHGSYGFRHPDPSYPFGVRLKRLPDWLPGAPWRDDVTMSWILVDRAGRRFMNEYEPYMQDTGHRALEGFDFASGVNRNLPALLVVDEPGRERYPLSAPTWHDAAVARDYARLTPRDFDSAILRRFDTLADLAMAFGRDPATLRASVETWNAQVDRADPDPFGRPVQGRAPIRTAPYSAAEVWPVVSNTQGGPAHDEHQRVLDAFGSPIPGLFEAGEVGSVFGHIYMSGGNLAESFIGGRIAGRNAAAAARNGGIKA